MRSAAGPRNGGWCIASRPSVLSRRSLRLAFNCGLRAIQSSPLVWAALLSWRSLWSSAWIGWFDVFFRRSMWAKTDDGPTSFRAGFWCPI
jgi:hypothetical protein